MAVARDPASRFGQRRCLWARANPLEVLECPGWERDGGGFPGASK